MRFQAPVLHTFRLPIRLVEAQFGRENYDDCGDVVAGHVLGLLNGASGLHGLESNTASWAHQQKATDNARLPIDWDFDDEHPNPWFHTLNFTLKLPSSELAPHIVAMLHRLGLADPIEQPQNKRARRAARAQKKATQQGG